MARRAVRLLLAVVLAAVLFHLDAAVEGKEAPPRCEVCQVMRLDITTLSSVNKVPAIGKITGIAENVSMADVVQLVFHDEKWRCNATCRTRIKSALLEVMKLDNDIGRFINDRKPSIQQLIDEFLCKSTRKGEDEHNKIKGLGSYVKEGPWLFLGWMQKMVKPTNWAEECKNLQSSWLDCGFQKSCFCPQWTVEKQRWKSSCGKSRRLFG